MLTKEKNTAPAAKRPGSSHLPTEESLTGLRTPQPPSGDSRVGAGEVPLQRCSQGDKQDFCHPPPRTQQWPLTKTGMRAATIKLTPEPECEDRPSIHSFTVEIPTYYTTPPFKVYDSMVFSILTKLYNHLPLPNPKTFHRPERETPHHTPQWLSRPRPPLTHVLSLRVCPFWKFHVNGIRQCVALVSGFFRFPHCVRVSCES